MEIKGLALLPIIMEVLFPGNNGSYLVVCDDQNNLVLSKGISISSSTAISTNVCVDNSANFLDGSYGNKTKIMYDPLLRRCYEIATRHFSHDGKVFTLYQGVDISSKYECVNNHSEKLNSLEEKAYIDSLTKIYTRNYLDEKVPKIIKKANRDGKKLTFTIIDIDNFKYVNDQYGHVTGDEVIHGTAQAIKNSVREIDHVIRLGGDEFLVISIDNQGAYQRAEQIKEKIESTCYSHRFGEFSKTVSIGVAQCGIPPKGIESYNDYFNSIIEEVDEALAHSKANGKNQVTETIFSGKIRTPAERRQLIRKK